jgi:hypothetical protein
MAEPDKRTAFLEFAEQVSSEAERTTDRETAEMLLTLAARYMRMSEGSPPEKTRAVNDEQRCALSLLARHQGGCPEEVLRAEGFSVGQWTALVMDGFARMQHTVIPGASQEKVAAVMR